MSTARRSSPPHVLPTLTEADVAALRSHVEASTVDHVAAASQLTPESVLRILAKLPVRKGTILIALAFLNSTRKNRR